MRASGAAAMSRAPPGRSALLVQRRPTRGAFRRWRCTRSRRAARSSRSSKRWAPARFASCTKGTSPATWTSVRYTIAESDPVHHGGRERDRDDVEHPRVAAGARERPDAGGEHQRRCGDRKARADFVWQTERIARASPEHGPQALVTAAASDRPTQEAEVEHEQRDGGQRVPARERARVRPARAPLFASATVTTRGYP